MPAPKPAAKPAKAAKSAPAEPFDERAPRQGPLGEIPRKTESDLIAEAAKAE